MPPEILKNVFDYCTVADQIILAVSSKRLLSVAALCRVQVPNRHAHIAPWVHQESHRGNHLPCCRCRNMGDILRRFRPRSAQRRVNRAWGICVDCMRYLPTRKRYWSSALSSVLGSGNLAVWGRAEEEMWEFAVHCFRQGVKIQCPQCRLKEWATDAELPHRPLATTLLFGAVEAAGTTNDI